jgi:enamine deaminase RidA (YjgF/YER057c/UK114 family)
VKEEAGERRGSGSGALGIVSPPGLARPRGYSHGILVPAGRRLLMVAGQVGWDAEERLAPGGFVPQFTQALENVMAVVREAGGAPDDIARLTIYVADRQQYLASSKEVGAAYRALMGRHFPAMALVEVAALLEPGALVEIEATAAVS